MGNISPVQLIIVLVIVVLIFGTSKLKGMGKDFGGAVKGFKKAMNDEETKPEETTESAETANLEQKADAEFSETQAKSKDETKS
ncbi:Sec-independent protein translocase subunit TatA [Marinicellulosiphila megalodicopiae]|uniref:Sec-independent protein translocase subunit TatA n=1 Tax=Marinicellulosiphila megalodicopiae TaxID=2724896 RepID=UPI003BAE1F45